MVEFHLKGGKQNRRNALARLIADGAPPRHRRTPTEALIGDGPGIGSKVSHGINDGFSAPAAAGGVDGGIGVDDGTGTLPVRPQHFC
jgi:hypothetical protein